MDESHSLPLAATDGFFAGFIVVCAVQNYFRSVAFCGRNFDKRSGQGHHNLRANTVPSRVIRDALSVVSCGRSNDATISLLSTQRKKFVESSALLESSRTLQVVEFEINGITGVLRKIFRTRAGREIDGVANAGHRSMDVGERKRVIESADRFRHKHGFGHFLRDLCELAVKSSLPQRTQRELRKQGPRNCQAEMSSRF